MTTAIVCGLGASYMTSRLLAERGQDEITKVTVLVAKKQLDMSMQIKKPEDCLELKEFTQGEEPKNALTELDKVKDKFLKHSLRKGDFVTAEDLWDNPLNLDVPAGMRAIGVRVNLADIAGGFASLPGSKVDIISTIRRPSDEDSNASILLQNVLVLAADAVKDRTEGSTALPATVVTVAVTPEDALRVALAKDLGPLTLMLRRPGDTAKAENEKVSVAKLLHKNSGKVETTGGTKFVEEPGATVVQNPVTPPPVQVKNDVPPPLEKRKWVVTVYEGEHSRKVVYVLNDNGEVNQEEVIETPPDLNPAHSPAPQPPVVAPRPLVGPPAPPAGPPHAGPKGHPRVPAGLGQ
jgi:pilus assembly protein CpaB